jgi:hypothetical protein
MITVNETRFPKLRGDRCRCSTCGELFNSTLAFDKHRVGQYGSSRRCLYALGMTARGMSKLDDGFWVTRRRVIAGMPLEATTAIPQGVIAPGECQSRTRAPGPPKCGLSIPGSLNQLSSHNGEASR